MTRQDVLAALYGKDGYISGEELSRELGVSRTAVNQAVKALRKDGFEIDSITNRGYKLLSAPDLLSAGILQSFLGKERMQHVLCYEVTDSTNLRLQELGQDPSVPGGTAALANEQTIGRGRRGRIFVSAPDTGIYLSMLLRPSEMQPAARMDIWTRITSWTAVAVCNAVETVYGLRPGIKWVNDLLLNGRKICGILTQMEMESETGEIREIIIGIGINVQQTRSDFPEELREIAGSLYQETGIRVPRARLAAEVIRELDRMIEAWPNESSYLNRYRKDSIVVGKNIRVLTSSGEKKAAAVSIGDDFSLLVRYEDGSEESLHGGEISIRPF